MEPVKVTAIMDSNGADATSGTLSVPPWRSSGRGTAVATLDGTGAIGTTVTVSGSTDNVHFVSLGTIVLSGNDAVAGKLAIDYPWPILKAVASSGSGTRARLQTVLIQ